MLRKIRLNYFVVLVRLDERMDRKCQLTQMLRDFEDSVTRQIWYHPITAVIFNLFLETFLKKIFLGVKRRQYRIIVRSNIRRT